MFICLNNLQISYIILCVQLYNLHSLIGYTYTILFQRLCRHNSASSIINFYSKIMVDIARYRGNPLICVKTSKIRALLYNLIEHFLSSSLSQWFRRHRFIKGLSTLLKLFLLLLSASCVLFLAGFIFIVLNRPIFEKSKIKFPLDIAWIMLNNKKYSICKVHSVYVFKIEKKIKLD